MGGDRDRRTCRCSTCSAGAPITLSLTPVLCDQLEAPGAIDAVRRVSGARSGPSRTRVTSTGSGEPASRVGVAELERSAARVRGGGARRLGARPGGLLDALGEHATLDVGGDPRGAAAARHRRAASTLQVQTGIDSHRRRFGDWDGGFWLPECAHAPWLDPLLEEAGVRATCVELTNVFGLGDQRHLTPLATDAGPVLWPIDRATMSLVWSERGYPASAAYRDYHDLTAHHHRVWRNDGGAYDHDGGASLAAEHAAGLRRARRRSRRRWRRVRVRARHRAARPLVVRGGAVAAAVLEEAARQGLALTTLDDALERTTRRPPPRHLRRHELGERRRPAHLERTGGRRARLAGPGGRARGSSGPTRPARGRALRELLALQSSDWAFLAARGTAGDYPRERARGARGGVRARDAGDLELEPEPAPALRRTLARPPPGRR